MTTHYGSEDDYSTRIVHALTVHTLGGSSELTCASEKEGIDSLLTLYEHFRKCAGLRVEYKKDIVQPAIKVSW